MPKRQAKSNGKAGAAERATGGSVAQSLRGVRLAFLHPDLGVGGAERLVVDAALGAQQRGADVTLYTSRHDPARCFAETRSGALRVAVHGAWLPRHVAGRLHVLCAWLRMLWLTLIVALRGAPADAFVVDQISIGVPLLRALGGGAPVLFYVHFPDQLLAPHRTALQRAYRAPIDALERATTRAADALLANSAFTQRVARDTLRCATTVLHPGVNLARFDRAAPRTPLRAELARAVERALAAGAPLLLSINRFERKKRLDVALAALAVLVRARRRRRAPPPHLLLAGGFDDAVRENVEHLAELQRAARESGVAEHVTFVPSFSDAERALMLRHAALLLYTPPNEHFGIVPLEAMYSGVPVVACASGGPCETVLDGVTGRLCECDGDAFGRAALDILDGGDALRAKMGAAGRERVAQHFSLDAFSDKLADHIRSAIESKKGR